MSCIELVKVSNKTSRSLKFWFGVQVSTSRQAAGDEEDPAAVLGAAKGRLVSPGSSWRQCPLMLGLQHHKLIDTRLLSQCHVYRSCRDI